MRIAGRVQPRWLSAAVTNTSMHTGPSQIQPRADRRTRAWAEARSSEPRADRRTRAWAEARSSVLFQATSHIAQKAVQAESRASRRLAGLAESRERISPAVSAEPTQATRGIQT